MIRDLMYSTSCVYAYPLRDLCPPLYRRVAGFTRQSPNRLRRRSPNRIQLGLLHRRQAESLPYPTGVLSRKYPARVLLRVAGPTQPLSGWPYWAVVRVPGLVSSTLDFKVLGVDGGTEGEDVLSTPDQSRRAHHIFGDLAKRPRQGHPANTLMGV